jgi:hypothetical protein
MNTQRSYLAAIDRQRGREGGREREREREKEVY